MSKKVKEKSPYIKQVIGGTHATLDKSILGRLKAVDYAISREGEFAMLSLVEGVDPATISGVASRNSLGFICHNGDADVLDINKLPLPDRDNFWGLTKAQKKTVDISYVATIRGCPYSCTYCASPYSWKRNKTQFRNPDSVLMELHHIKNNYWDRNREYDYSASANIESKNKLLIKDNSMIYFVEDVFAINKRRTKEILRRMIEDKLNMPFKVETRVDHLDEEICELLKEAGCMRAKVGFETGSDKILKQIQKGETKSDMIRGSKMLRNAGVPFVCYLMTGFVGETDDDLDETIKLAREIKADYYSLSILAPYYGTKMYFDLIKEGHPLDKESWEYFYHQGKKMMANNTISQEKLKEYLSLAELNDNKNYV